MAETESETSTATETPAEPSVAKLDERVGRIEAAVNTLIDKLHGRSQSAVETKLDEDSTVAAEVQRELARRDEQTKEQERIAKLGELESTVAKLTEKTPTPPPRRVERIMGWDR
jgi:hypothetical protein